MQDFAKLGVALCAAALAWTMGCQQKAARGGAGGDASAGVSSSDSQGMGGYSSGSESSSATGTTSGATGSDSSVQAAVVAYTFATDAQDWTMVSGPGNVSWSHDSAKPPGGSVVVTAEFTDSTCSNVGETTPITAGGPFADMTMSGWVRVDTPPTTDGHSHPTGTVQLFATDNGGNLLVGDNYTIGSTLPLHQWTELRLPFTGTINGNQADWSVLRGLGVSIMADGSTGSPTYQTARIYISNVTVHR